MFSFSGDQVLGVSSSIAVVVLVLLWNKLNVPTQNTSRQRPSCKEGAAHHCGSLISKLYRKIRWHPISKLARMAMEVPLPMGTRLLLIRPQDTSARLLQVQHHARVYTKGMPARYMLSVVRAVVRLLLVCSVLGA